MRLSWSLILIFVSPVALAMHIIIDPGHGGTDQGATYGKITESALTLQVAKMVADELKKDSRFSVSLTRETDVYLSLEQRVQMANAAGDVFLSLHVNSSNDPKARGKEIYFQNQLPADQESLFLANRENQNEKFKSLPKEAGVAATILSDKKEMNSDVRAIIEDLVRNHHFKLSGLLAESLFHNWNGEKFHRRRTIRQAPFIVISHINKPAVLIEIGYLTNPEEAKKLVTAEYQKKIAIGIYRAFLNFKEYMDKSAEKSLN